ncbi:hypothetical protein [Enterococcus sp. 5H]|uniref:hypothetical protein n=1 Tax=Enterococcus sp. 5H TaxID=1229490 RepID=UPI0023038F89|nr:hypothetical protein [Enterococcus sp. 5H]MDA9471659.1 hypothetical protein [Enterococcus sp. 5H]
MERLEKLNMLQSVFSEKKKFIGDGYYRIRSIDDVTLELTFLIAGSCGETIVHPQITVTLDQSQAIGTKLIDMDTSPPKFLYRNSSNADEIDDALDNLIEKFLRIK